MSLFSLYKEVKMGMLRFFKDGEFLDFSKIIKILRDSRWVRNTRRAKKDKKED